MKIYNSNLKKMFFGTMMENDGHGHINVYNINRELVSQVSSKNVKLIFNENEIPYMEEMK